MSQGGCLNSSVWQVVHPLISLTGGIFVWVGVWDYIIDYLHGDTAAYDWLYMLIGLAFLFLTRTLIAQAGLKSFLYHPSSTPSSPSIVTALIAYLSTTAPPPPSSSTSSIPVYLRSLLALLAGITFWLGCYNLFDLYLYPFGSVYRDLIYTAVGLTLMALTSNVASEGTVVADSSDPGSNVNLLKAPTTIITSAQSFLFYHLKALIGLFGDVVYWVGAYNLADTHIWPATPTRDSLYVVFGFLVFLGVSLWTYKERMEASERRTAERGDGGGEWALLQGSSGAGSASHTAMGDRIAFYLRCAVAMVAGILVWVGWWNVLSTWVVTGEVPAEEGGGNEEESHVAPFHTLSVVPLPVLGAEAVRRSFHLLQRSSTAESDFPMWVLYGTYAFTGLVFLVVSNTFTSQAGVIQPLGLIRQQANVGISANATGGAQPPSTQRQPPHGEQPPSIEALGGGEAGPFSHAVPSM